MLPHKNLVAMCCLARRWTILGQSCRHAARQEEIDTDVDWEQKSRQVLDANSLQILPPSNPYLSKSLTTTKAEIHLQAVVSFAAQDLKAKSRLVKTREKSIVGLHSELFPLKPYV